MGMVALSDDNRMLCCIYFRALFTSSVPCRLWESLSFKHILHLPVLLPSLDPPNLTVASKVLEKLTSAREWGPPFESYLWSCSPCHGTCSSRNDSLHLLRQRGVSMNQLAWPCCSLRWTFEALLHLARPRALPQVNLCHLSHAVFYTGGDNIGPNAFTFDWNWRESIYLVPFSLKLLWLVSWLKSWNWPPVDEFACFSDALTLKMEQSCRGLVPPHCEILTTSYAEILHSLTGASLLVSVVNDIINSHCNSMRWRK